MPVLRNSIVGDMIFGIGMAVLLVGFVIWGINRVLTLQSMEEIQPTAPSISDVLLAAPDSSLFTATPTLLPVEAFADEATPTIIIPTVNINVSVQVNLVAVERTYVRVIVDGEDCDSGEGRWAGETLVSAGPGPLRTFAFPSDLPNCRTSGRRILIATQGFADLGLIPPDYVMPRGFVQFPDGVLTFANVAQLRYSGLPNDGVHAIDGSGRRVGAYAENFAGQFAVVRPLPPRSTVDVVEFYNAALDHYFITWVAAEVAALDAGTQIRGWTRTGAQFKAHATAQPGTSPICRFYIPPALGDSHFFGPL